MAIPFDPDTMNALKFVSTADIAAVKEQMYELGYEKCRRDVLAVFAEFEPHMKLSLDMRNRLLDKVGKLRYRDGKD